MTPVPRPAARMVPISFEFYPPKTDDQRAQLDRAVRKLKGFAPTHASCTFGAGGSTLSPQGGRVTSADDADDTPDEPARDTGTGTGNL